MLDGRLEHDDPVGREDAGQDVHRRRGRERIRQLGRLERRARSRRLALPHAELGEERLERERRVGEQRVAHRRPRRLVGVARDRHERRALGEQRPGDVRVVGEDRRADDDHEVVAGERLGQRPDRRRQDALEEPVVSGKPSRPPPGAGVAHTARPRPSARATAASQPPLASMSGPATSTGRSAARSRAASSRTSLGVGRLAPGDRAAASGGRRRRRRPPGPSRPSGSTRTSAPWAAATADGPRARSRAGRRPRAAARSST